MEAECIELKSCTLTGALLPQRQWLGVRKRKRIEQAQLQVQSSLVSPSILHGIQMEWRDSDFVGSSVYTLKNVFYIALNN
jgi:hypothetical protein